MAPNPIHDVIRRCLESAEQARPTLLGWRLRDIERGWVNLTGLARAIGIDRLAELSQPLGRLLPRSPDPDMALNNLERFLANPAGAKQLPSLLEGRRALSRRCSSS